MCRQKANSSGFYLLESVSVYECCTFLRTLHSNCLHLLATCLFSRSVLLKKGLQTRNLKELIQRKESRIRFTKLLVECELCILFSMLRISW